MTREHVSLFNPNPGADMYLKLQENIKKLFDLNYIASNYKLTRISRQYVCN